MARPTGQPSSAPASEMPETVRVEVLVIGSGPGGAMTAALLAEAGLDVLLLEEGPDLPVGTPASFSRDEIAVKYRNGGITVATGAGKLLYAEGRCVGGGSEVNRGLYHRAPPEVLEAWRREYLVDGLSDADMAAHHEACERLVPVSQLPCAPAGFSVKLEEGASNLGWRTEAPPRFVEYRREAVSGRMVQRRRSMSETLLPRFVEAGGRLISNTRVEKLSRLGRAWNVRATNTRQPGNPRSLEIVASHVFVACGATQTPALLRRSGFKRHVGNSLRFHTMIKVVATFDEEVNHPGQLDPVHQIKEFDPRFSMGCSVSSAPLLALAMVDHPAHLPGVAANWQRMAIYYAQSIGGRGSVRTPPGFRDALVRWRHDPADMKNLADGLRHLAKSLFAAGAVALHPAFSGASPLRSPEEIAQLPEQIEPRRGGLSTVHLFSSCPMGEDRSRCATDSFGQVPGVNGLYLNDSAILPGPTWVNPQGTIMAIAHRNALRFLEKLGKAGGGGGLSVEAVPRQSPEPKAAS